MASEYLSLDKLNKLKEELDFLKTEKRTELAENLQRARSLGDLSENAEYHTAREEQGHVEDRIRQIEHIIKTSEVVNTTKGSGVVQVGSFVEIKKKGDKVSKKIEIVGGEESDMLSGKVSYKSPLGSALMGQVIDSIITVVTPKGEMVYKIISIG